jgi:uncharacterized membrane protein
MGTIAVLGGIGLYQVDQTRKAVKAQERAAGESLAAQNRAYEAEKQRANISSVRSIRQNIRQARLAASSMVNTGYQTGAVGSSGLAGGMSSIGSQVASNVNYTGTSSYLTNLSNINQLQSSQALMQGQVQSAKYQANAQIAGQLGDFVKYGDKKGWFG